MDANLWLWFRQILLALAFLAVGSVLTADRRPPSILAAVDPMKGSPAAM